MIIPAYIAVILAIPVLLLGEWCVRRIDFLRFCNIPASVVGGLIVAIFILLFHPWWPIEFATKVNPSWWTRIFSTEAEWHAHTQQNVILPFTVAFFTCMGLNGSWTLVKKGGIQVITLLVLGLVLGIVQNFVGIGLAKMLGISPLFGLVCGSITLTGGPSTALGFAPLLEEAGLKNAAALGIAAATFGIVASSLVGGPVATMIIRRKKLTSEAGTAETTADGTPVAGIVHDVRWLSDFVPAVVLYSVVLLLCFKAGALLTQMLSDMGLKFPVYMGALLLGLVLRNVADLFDWTFFKTKIIETMASVALGFFLVIALMSLNLHQLAVAGRSMLIILMVQVFVTAVFSGTITFLIMGLDYEAAVMTGGFIGFGLGITANAVANMKSLVESFGPAPRAFLVVPIVGAFLIDIVNSINITAFVNYLR